MINNSVVYLVYFNCRGTGHYFRYVLYEIGIPLQEIHVSSNGTMPQCLNNFSISLTDIPCVIIEGKVVKELYATLRYVCRKFNREDLLGSTLRQQAKISEIFCKNSKKKGQTIQVFIKYIPRIKKDPEKLKKIKQEMMQQINETSTSYGSCSLLYSQTGNYLFDHLTIADFLFYQNCYYLCNFFGDICKKSKPIYFAYKSFFERTQFYKKHKDKIEGFKFVVPQFNQSINQGFKLMWLGKHG